MSSGTDCLSPVHAFVLGAISRSIGLAIAHPFNLGRTLVQSGHTIDGKVVTSALGALALVLQSEGITGIFKGLFTDLIKGMLDAAVMMMVKEQIHSAVRAFFYRVAGRTTAVGATKKLHQAALPTQVKGKEARTPKPDCNTFSDDELPEELHPKHERKVTPFAAPSTQAIPVTSFQDTITEDEGDDYAEDEANMPVQHPRHERKTTPFVAPAQEKGAPSIQATIEEDDEDDDSNMPPQRPTYERKTTPFAAPTQKKEVAAIQPTIEEDEEDGTVQQHSKPKHGRTSTPFIAPTQEKLSASVQTTIEEDDEDEVEQETKEIVPAKSANAGSGKKKKKKSGNKKKKR